MHTCILSNLKKKSETYTRDGWQKVSKKPDTRMSNERHIVCSVTTVVHLKNCCRKHFSRQTKSELNHVNYLDY